MRASKPGIFVEWIYRRVLHELATRYKHEIFIGKRSFLKFGWNLIYYHAKIFLPIIWKCVAIPAELTASRHYASTLIVRANLLNIKAMFRRNGIITLLANETALRLMLPTRYIWALARRCEEMFSKIHSIMHLINSISRWKASFRVRFCRCLCACRALYAAQLEVAFISPSAAADMLGMKSCRYHQCQWGSTYDIENINIVAKADARYIIMSAAFIIKADFSFCICFAW